MAVAGGQAGARAFGSAACSTQLATIGSRLCSSLCATRRKVKGKDGDASGQQVVQDLFYISPAAAVACTCKEGRSTEVKLGWGVLGMRAASARAGALRAFTERAAQHPLLLLLLSAAEQALDDSQCR